MLILGFFDKKCQKYILKKNKIMWYAASMHKAPHGLLEKLLFHHARWLPTIAEP